MSNFNRLGFELSNGDTGSFGGEVINGTGEIDIYWSQDDPEELREPALCTRVSVADARRLAALLNDAADAAERVYVQEHITSAVTERDDRG